MWFRPPRWNDDNLLSQLYSGLLSSIILLKVYPCILSTRGSNHHQCGCRVLNTLSVKYRVRTIMKIIQIFQILTVSQDTRRVPDDRQTYSEEKHRHRRNVTIYTFFDKLHFFSFYDHLFLGKLGPLPIWRQIGLLYYIYLFWINSVEGHPLIDKYPPIVGKIYPIPISEFSN